MGLHSMQANEQAVCDLLTTQALQNSFGYLLLPGSQVAEPGESILKDWVLGPPRHLDVRAEV
ncbi:hypothetical protein IX84_03545 [Phaeodactylibacter xiamenensis]|uniref:Uncharacterized protein n=1 Tax=Phaeodactylibacter xiamenensis TaxID=1524460 RepID=A0A098SEM4_9BACT|nr:hypothetical protein IX84_03545 [Phaeodactylibacter xiamenensis]